VQDIASAAGVDVRALQRAFSVWLGLSPRQYIAELRLDALRAILVAGQEDVTVTSAAAACGLFHFGRVGQAYKLRFGELPSQTLRQSRAQLRTV
jgi:transcriptional regulator GlxA family with amidase domain